MCVLPSSAKSTWSTTRPGASTCHGTRPPIVAFGAIEETSAGFGVVGVGAAGSALCWRSSVARIASASAAWVRGACGAKLAGDGAEDALLRDGADLRRGPVTGAGKRGRRRRRASALRGRRLRRGGGSGVRSGPSIGERSRAARPPPPPNGDRAAGRAPRRAPRGRRRVPTASSSSPRGRAQS